MKNVAIPFLDYFDFSRVFWEGWGHSPHTPIKRELAVNQQKNSLISFIHVL